MPDREEVAARLAAILLAICSSMFMLAAVEYRIDTLGCALYVIALLLLQRERWLFAGAALCLAGFANIRLGPLIVATIAGMFLQRHRFPGRAVLIAMLTFPLAFPGVVVGFLIILLAGRQGLIGDVTNRLFGEKLVFAYSIQGLFLGYLYFSIPRVILTIMAAVQKLDVGLEELDRLGNQIVKVEAVRLAQSPLVFLEDVPVTLADK